MINHIKFIDGFAPGLPCISNKTFEFKPGINILFGPNGCGKSTILKTLKAYCGIMKGGWTAVSDPSKLGTGHVQYGFPHLYSHYAPGKCKAEVSWDGTPSFFNDGDIKVSETFFFQNVGNCGDDGITSEAEQMDILMKKPSSGQYRIGRLEKVFDTTKSAPVPKAPLKADIARMNRERNYWRSLANSGPLTVMLDEPERALCLPLQKQVLCDVIPKEMNDKQVIIATHSVFALEVEGANLIDMEPGYIDVCKKLLHEGFSNNE